MGADSRSTQGDSIANKYSQKVHRITDRIVYVVGETYTIAWLEITSLFSSCLLISRIFSFRLLGLVAPVRPQISIRSPICYRRRRNCANWTPDVWQGSFLSCATPDSICLSMTTFERVFGSSLGYFITFDIMIYCILWDIKATLGLICYLAA